MESYTDMKYSDCGGSGRCRKVSGNRNQSVRSCLDPAMQAGSGVRYPQMGNQMNDGKYAGDVRKRLSFGNGLCTMAAVADALWTRAWLSPGNHLFRAGPGL